MSSDDIPPGSDADELVRDEPALRLRPWSAFAFVDYRFLWLSGLFILITTNLRLLSSTVWLFDETGSAAVLGLIGGVQLVVQIPALLYGGTLADRVNRKRLMSGMQASTLVVAAFIALLAVTGLLRPWHIFLSVGLTSITAVVGEPARSALMQAVVPRTHIMHAVTSNTLTFQVAAIASPLVFAGVVAMFGITPAFVMVAFTAIPVFSCRGSFARAASRRTPHPAVRCRTKLSTGSAS